MVRYLVSGLALRPDVWVQLVTVMGPTFKDNYDLPWSLTGPLRLFVATNVAPCRGFRYLNAGHRLRPIDIQLELYTMLYNNSAKNSYAEPVRNQNNEILQDQGL